MQSFFTRIYRTLLSVNDSYTYTSLKDLEHLADQRKRLLLKTCFYIMFAMLFLFSLLNAFVYQEVSNYVFMLKLISLVIILYLIAQLHRNPTPQNINKLAKLSSFIFAAFLLFLIDLNQAQNFSLIWVFFFPIFAMTINGSKTGLRYTLVFITLLLLLAYNHIGHWQSGLWNELSFIRLMAASLILTFIIYLNEVSLNNAKLQAKSALEELQTLSTTDELTGIFNRRHINDTLGKAIQNAERYNAPLTLTLFDIDDFKKINDQYGHIIGDKILNEMVEKIQKNIRSTDSCRRWGGEEFLIILPHETRESAIQFCEKIRTTVEEMRFSEPSIQITCSFGIAQLQKSMAAEELIDQADQALYIAKTSGKNQIKTAS